MIADDGDGKLMDTCDSQLLSAYFDGELSVVDRDRVAAHVSDCPGCASELESIRESSHLLQSHHFEDLTEAESQRLRDAIDAAGTRDDRPVIRLGLTLGTLAASVLVISGVWLMELPAPASRPHSVVAPAAPWERMAMTLRPDPITPLEDQQRQLQFADAMINGVQP